MLLGAQARLGARRTGPIAPPPRRAPGESRAIAYSEPLSAQFAYPLAQVPEGVIKVGGEQGCLGLLVPGEKAAFFQVAHFIH